MATCSWSCGLITTRSCYSLPFTTALPLPTQHRRCLRCRAAQTTETRIKWRREMSQPRTKNSARVTIEISIDRYPRPWMGMRKLEVWSRGDPKKRAPENSFWERNRGGARHVKLRTNACGHLPPSSPPLLKTRATGAMEKASFRFRSVHAPDDPGETKDEFFFYPHERDLLLSSCSYRQ